MHQPTRETTPPTAASAITRRFFAGVGSLATGSLLFGPNGASGSQGTAAATRAAELHPTYPSQEADAVRAVVGASHGNLQRVRELVDERPELCNAAWDWGFGDWETALGAAAHTGNREIALYLLGQGARPDLFCAAMLGQLEVVRGMLESSTGTVIPPGPHGISLMAHAKAGGEPAAAVVDYLATVEGADQRTADLPLEREAASFVGSYLVGSGELDRFEVELRARDQQLMWTRVGTVSRMLLHQGGDRFQPSGARSAQIRFVFEEDAVQRLEIYNPDLVVTAQRADP